MEEWWTVLDVFSDRWQVIGGECSSNALGMGDVRVCGGCGATGPGGLQIIGHNRCMEMWRGFEHCKTVWLWMAKPGFGSAVFARSVCGWEFKVSVVTDTQKEATILQF